MPLIKDFNKYVIGIEIADKHHKNLLDIVNELYDSLLKGANKELILHYLKRLELFSLTHFKAEEELMLRVGYPDFTNHKAIHAKFIEEMYEFKILNQLKPIGKDLITYLISWIMEHILVVDKKYADFIKDNKKEES